MTCRPAQHLVPTERPPDDRAKMRNAEQINEALLHVDHVLHGHEREVAAVRLAGFRIDRDGPGRATAAAENVRANHEEALGIEGLTRADHTFPPAEIVVGVVTCRVRVSCDRMADEDRVVPLGVQGAVGFVGNLDAREYLAVTKLQRLWEHSGLYVTKRSTTSNRVRAFERVDHGA